TIRRDLKEITGRVGVFGWHERCASQARLSTTEERKTVTGTRRKAARARTAALVRGAGRGKCARENRPVAAAGKAGATGNRGLSVAGLHARETRRCWLLCARAETAGATRANPSSAVKSRNPGAGFFLPAAISGPLEPCARRDPRRRG